MLDEFVDLDDSRVLEATQSLRLGPGPRQFPTISATQSLQGHEAANPDLTGLVHNPHPTPTENAHNLVARESRPIGGIGGVSFASRSLESRWQRLRSDCPLVPQSHQKLVGGIRSSVKLLGDRFAGGANLQMFGNSIQIALGECAPMECQQLDFGRAGRGHVAHPGSGDHLGQ
jgi:hypothetical protein